MWIEQCIVAETPEEQKDSTELNQEVFNISNMTRADYAAFQEASETWDYSQLTRAPFYKAQLEAINNELANNPNCDLSDIDIASLLDLSWEMTEAQKAAMSDLLEPILPEIQLAVQDWRISGTEYWRIIQASIQTFQ